MSSYNYQSFFGLRQAPFDEATNPAYLFMTPSIQSAINGIVAAIHSSEPYAVLSAESGSGKSIIARSLPAQLGSGCLCASVTDPSIDATQMLCTMLDAFAITDPAYTDDQDGQALTEQLNSALIARHNMHKQCVLVIDDAHLLPMQVLHWLCQLGRVNDDQSKLLQIVLVGNSQLLQSLRHVQMHELLQRAATWHRIDALDTAQIESYFQFRMTWAGLQTPIHFDPDSLQQIHQLTGGQPKQMHILFEQILDHMATQSKWTVSATDVHAISDPTADHADSPQQPPQDVEPAPATITTETLQSTKPQTWQRAAAVMAVIAMMIGAAASGMFGGDLRTTQGSISAASSKPRAHQPATQHLSQQPVQIDLKPNAQTASTKDKTIDPDSSIILSVKQGKSRHASSMRQPAASSKATPSKATIDDAWMMFEQMTDSSLGGASPSPTPIAPSQKSPTLDAAQSWGVVLGHYDSPDQAQQAVQNAASHLQHKNANTQLQLFIAESGDHYVGLLGGITDEQNAAKVSDDLNRFGYVSQAMPVDFSK